MKSKILISVILIVCIGCSNKNEIGHYACLELQYITLSGKTDFIIKDQQGVLDEGLVTILETDSPTFRKATHEDELKAIELLAKMETLKKFLNESADNCKELRQLYKGKNFINSRKRQPEIDLLTQFIEVTDKSILKVTDGIDPRTYINQLVPKNLREL